MEESLLVEGVGIEITNKEKQDNNNITFLLSPKETKFIEIRATKVNWSVKSLVSYKIEFLPNTENASIDN